MISIGVLEVISFTHGTVCPAELSHVAFNNKIVTVTPSGDFLIFDINRGRLGRFRTTRFSPP